MKRTAAILLVAASCVLMLAGCNATDYRNAKKLIESRDYTGAAEILTALGDYRDAGELLRECNDMIAAIDGFASAAQGLQEKNDELDRAIEEASAVAEAGMPALDENLRQELKDAIADASSAKIEIPLQPEEYEEITAETERMQSVDYSAQTGLLGDKADVLADSFDRCALICAPSEEYVIACLENVGGVMQIAPATPGHDPNGYLGRPGSYYAAVFFSYDKVDQSAVRGRNIYEKGTSAGGLIEVFATAEDAEMRDQYLSLYDGTSFRIGSHRIYGTIIVRISEELEEADQLDLESRVIEALTQTE